jgi:hypothetical protein
VVNHMNEIVESVIMNNVNTTIWDRAPVLLSGNIFAPLNFDTLYYRHPYTAIRKFIHEEIRKSM